jgi:hypothetical protein
MMQQKESATWDEMQNMKSIKVKIEQVYVDPNNPRFAVAGKEWVPDKRITEEGVQAEAIREVARSGINALMNSIRASGFWMVDRVVLRRLDKENFVVVEGNRRVTALKILWEDHSKGKITLPSNITSGIKGFEVLVYEGKNPNIAWIVQGFRHTPGIEPWQRYTQARFLADYERQTRISPQDIASIFGIKPKKLAGDLIRAYIGFEQAQKDEDYGDVLTPSQFGLFDEIIFAKPAIKNWLGWDDETRELKEKRNLNEVLSWVPGEDEKRTISSAKTIDISPSTRDTLAKLVGPEHKSLFEKFRSGELSIRQCEKEIGKFEAKVSPIDMSVTIASLQEMKSVIAQLPIPVLQKAKTEEQVKQKNQVLALLQEIAGLLGQQINNLKK